MIENGLLLIGEKRFKVELSDYKILTMVDDVQEAINISQPLTVIKKEEKN